MISDEDWQRLKNMMIFKVYMTDRELEEISPLFLVLGVIALVIILWITCCSPNRSRSDSAQPSQESYHERRPGPKSF